MSYHECNQGSAFERVEKKLDIIEQKLDKFTERIVKTEAQIGMITTGFVVIGGPLIVAIITYLL